MNGPFLASAVAVLVGIGFLLAWRAGGAPGRPLAPATPVRIVALGYLVMYGVGSIWLAVTGEATGGPALVAGGMLAIGVGATLVTWRLGRPEVMPTDSIVGTLRAWVAVGLAVVGLVAFAWIAAGNGIPLLSEDPQGTRTAWGGYAFDMFRWLVPPVALVTLAVALAAGRRDAWALALAGLAAVAGLEILVASRALPFELGLAALLLAWWAGRRLRAGAWVLVLGAAAMIFLGVLFARLSPGGSFSSPLDALVFAVNRTVNRVLLIHPRTIDLTVELFPDEEPYLGGSTYTRWLARATGGEPEPPLGAWLFEQLFPGEPPGGFAAPGVLAEGYANGGPLLALALMLALGGGSAWLGRRQPDWPPGAATRVLGALLIVALMRTYATSLNGFVLTAAAAVAWWVAVGAPLGRLRRALARRSEPARREASQALDDQAPPGPV